MSDRSLHRLISALLCLKFRDRSLTASHLLKSMENAKRRRNVNRSPHRVLHSMHASPSPCPCLALVVKRTMKEQQLSVWLHHIAVLPMRGLLRLLRRWDHLKMKQGIVLHHCRRVIGRTPGRLGVLPKPRGASRPGQPCARKSLCLRMTFVRVTEAYCDAMPEVVVCTLPSASRAQGGE